MDLTLGQAILILSLMTSAFIGLTYGRKLKRKLVQMAADKKKWKAEREAEHEKRQAELQEEYTKRGWRSPSASISPMGSVSWPSRFGGPSYSPSNPNSYSLSASGSYSQSLSGSPSSSPSESYTPSQMYYRRLRRKSR